MRRGREEAVLRTEGQKLARRAASPSRVHDARHARLLLAAILPHVPSPAQAITWVQGLVDTQGGRRCVAAVFLAFHAVLSHLQDGVAACNGARGGKDDGRSEADGHGTGDEALLQARRVCADCWQALHATGPSRHWRSIDPAWREAYALGCMLRALVVLVDAARQDARPGPDHGCAKDSLDGISIPARLLPATERGKTEEETALHAEMRVWLGAAAAVEEGVCDGQWWAEEEKEKVARGQTTEDEWLEGGSATASLGRSQLAGTALTRSGIEAVRWLDMGLLFGGERVWPLVHVYLSLSCNPPHLPPIHTTHKYRCGHTYMNLWRL